MKRNEPESASAEPREPAAAAEPRPEIDPLVARAQTGDRTAFAELFHRHKRDVARLVFRMTGPRADSDDLIQEVFLQVHKSLHDFRGQSRFTTWLHRVTVNVVLMARRAAKSRPVFATDPVDDERQVDHGVRPDEDAVRREQAQAFFNLLERLAEKKRIVFVLHELEGRSPAEIAEIVGAPILTVRTRLFYARRELEEMMKSSPALVHLRAGFGKTEGADPPKRAKKGEP